MKTSFDPALSIPPYQPPTRPHAQPAVNEQYRSQSQEINITLTTKEGDRITISQGASTAQHTLTTRSKEGMQALNERVMAAGMSIQLEGDLNEQEINDLLGVFQDLSGIASDFFSGNLAGAVKGATNIGDMGSITELNATFSRTSVFAERLQGPHPLPSLFDLAHDQQLPQATPPDQQKPGEGPRLSNALPVLWQQFIDELVKLDAPPPRPTDDSARQPASRTGERMLDRSRETMHDHPRLTPLMPSLASLAIDQAARQFTQGQPLQQLASELTDSFRNAFNSWVL